MRIERVTIPDNSYRFVLGSVPHGFVEVTPLDPALWTQLYLEPSVVSDDDEFDGSDERVVFWHTDHFSLDEGHEGWAFGDGESGSWEDYQAWEGVTESC